MKRLTNKKEADAQRKAYKRRLEQGYPRNVPEERYLKLAEYEDTGFEPKQISEIQDLCEDYVKVGLDARFIRACIETRKLGTSNRLLDIATAEADGRLVILPCNVGDTVFKITRHRVDVSGYRMEWEWETYVEAIKFRYSMLDAIGKTVFLTREEAENALKNMEDDNG